MCQFCPVAEPARVTRRRFIGRLAGAAAAAGLLRATRVAAQPDRPAVAKTGWARIVTPDPNWNYHEHQDQALVAFARGNTHLQFDSAFHFADPGQLEQLCARPFLFSADLRSIAEPRHFANLREYLYRGGFIFLDNCLHISPDVEEFKREHLALFQRLLPGAQMRELSPQHRIFHAYFQLQQSQIAVDPYDPRQSYSFFGIYDDDRMIALISMAHLLCVWHVPTAHPDKKSNALIVNFYAYALAQS